MRVDKSFAALIQDNECHYNDPQPFQMKTGNTKTVLQEGDRVAFAAATCDKQK
jgi:hypothetical protein